MSWIKSHLLSNPVGLGAAASTNACAAPVIIRHTVHAPSVLWIPDNFLLAWACSLPVTEAQWEPPAYENSECSFPTRSPLQWKRFKYFGNHTSQKFSLEAHKSLMGIQSQIIPSFSGCDADLHIKCGRTIWKREFQLILITCQVEYKSFSFEHSGGCRGSM